MRPFRFNITVLTCALGLLLTAGASRAETEIIYVDRNATYPYTGQSWCWAYHTIQEALDAADSEADTEIRVADGVYIPTLGNGRLKTFKLQESRRDTGRICRLRGRRPGRPRFHCLRDYPQR